MKKFIPLFLIILLSSFLTSEALAALVPGENMAPGTLKPGTLPSSENLNFPPSPIKESSELIDVIARIVGWIYIIFFIIAVMYILFAAFNYLTGANDPEKIKTGRNQIIYAAIAIAIALLAVGARTIIEGFLGGGRSILFIF